MAATFKHVLIVDDEPVSARLLQKVASTNGFHADICDSGEAALEKLSKTKHFPDIILLDVLMPGMDGFETFEKIRSNFKDQDVPIIFITATMDKETIKRCFEVGAADYISKPVRENEFIARLNLHLALQTNLYELNEVQRENAKLRDSLLGGTLKRPHEFDEILTVSNKMHAIFQYLESISQSSRPVFICGETGVGKELVAKATHRLSNRKGEFVTLNVAGLDDNLFSDTLFGHTKGAFTGAHSDRDGLIERAVGGTLFLDEIGDLDKISQVKMLRLLQEGEYYPLGSDQPKWSDARILVATNLNVEELVEQGSFRRDLYYRLLTHHVLIPPLRDRLCDLPMLIDHFMKNACEALGRKPVIIDKETLNLLESYHFPGNIRELEAMIFDAVSRTRGRTLSKDAILKAVEKGATFAMHSKAHDRQPSSAKSSEESLEQYLQGNFPTLREMTQMLIDTALERSNGNQSIAAKMLGISRQALNKRLRRAQESDS